MSYDNFPIAVVDNGGQWTHKEYRVLNYLGCRAEIVSNVTPIAELERFKALSYRCFSLPTGMNHFSH